VDRQRIDKWLWHARVVRTRAAAAALANGGQVRVNGERVQAASRAVKAGDVVTVALDRTVRVMQVAGFAERRGGPEAARLLYEDMTPKAPAAVADGGAGGADSAPARDSGAGRPTKRERRALDRLLGGEEQE
jgi:ribosome-associated heat shock protein Hsp15